MNRVFTKQEGELRHKLDDEMFLLLDNLNMAIYKAIEQGVVPDVCVVEVEASSPKPFPCVKVSFFRDGDIVSD